MGCDIHVYLEYKEDDYYYFSKEAIFDGKISPRIWRDYNTFGILAGVRNYNNFIPIAPPRGLPKDVTGAVAGLRRDYGSDGHSTSYLTIKEIKDRINQNNENEESFKAALEGLINTIENSFSLSFWCVDDFRIVFWFDN
jgi:hypothetical protein